MNTFKENIIKYGSLITLLNKTLKKASFLRLLIFVSFIISIIILLNLQWFGALFLAFLVFAALFLVSVKYYEKTAHELTHTKLLKRINQFEIAKLASSLDEFDDGNRFIDPDHPYTSDLDIFGQHSIFQLLNRTTTESGKMLLADWLSQPAVKVEIIERQNAIKELFPKLDWRQKLQAVGMPHENKNSDYDRLIHWADQPVSLLNNRTIYILFAIAGSVAAVTTFILFLLNLTLFLGGQGGAIWPVYFASYMTITLLNSLYLKRISPQAEEIIKGTFNNIKTLKGYFAMIKVIETEPFKSKKLAQLKQELSSENYSVTQEIHRLITLLEFFINRGSSKEVVGGNFMYAIFNSFLLFDVHLILKVEKWKVKNRAHLASWSQSVSQFEVLSSLAGLRFSNDTYNFPEISEAPNEIEFSSVGHPLIAARQRICNDFRLKGAGDIMLITGSNMAGKSTYLRAVGVNMVLALMGAPCCASSGKIAITNIFSSMRTQDKLKEGSSSFHAELTRIEKLFALTGSGKNVFFLLDEVFKGTNSKDRHIGGFSLINQLHGLGVNGIIATHDTKMAKWAGQENLVNNYSFNSSIQQDKMTFDYKLRNGICKDFNASELMKRSGINILSNLMESKH